jgi:predicted phage terminase large subunit-like protein
MTPTRKRLSTNARAARPAADPRLAAATDAGTGANRPAAGCAWLGPGSRSQNLDVLFEYFCNALAWLHGETRRRHADVRPAASLLLPWTTTYLARHFALPPSFMHRWMAVKLDYFTRQRGARLNVLGPRGSAKSTLGALAYPLRAALEATEPYIWIVSDTHDQAETHLKNLKKELVDNPAIAAAYPDAAGRGPVWRADAIVLRSGVAIEAYGAGQRIRGRRHEADRPTLIVCDDLQNDSHTRSARARELSRQWFHGTLLQAGSPRTNVVNLATALHREALAMELHHTPGWVSRLFASIALWPTDVELWRQWEAVYTDVQRRNRVSSARRFYVKNRQRMDAGAKVLWPEREDLYALMRLRAEIGRAAFDREKQNSPIDPAQCEWPESYFDEHIWFDEWPEGLVVKTLALDPSKGADSRHGDYSALVALGVDRRGVLYVEADLARRPVAQIVADGVALYHRFQPDAFGVEANQFQELLGGLFETEFARQGVLGARPWLVDNHVNKLVRIRRLGPYLASGRLRFKHNSPSTKLLVDQLRDFPVGDHDDGPDAAEMAVRLAVELTNTPNTDDGLGNRLVVGQ